MCDLLWVFSRVTCLAAQSDTSPVLDACRLCVSGIFHVCCISLCVTRSAAWWSTLICSMKIDQKTDVCSRPPRLADALRTEGTEGHAARVPRFGTTQIRVMALLSIAPHAKGIVLT